MEKEKEIFLSFHRQGIFFLSLFQCYFMPPTNGANVFCFLSSLPLFPQPPRQCLDPTCHLSALNLHCIAGAGLPIHMIREVWLEPKRRRAWSSNGPSRTYPNNPAMSEKHTRNLKPFILLVLRGSHPAETELYSGRYHA
jgi:hypothetical protein